MSHVRKLLSLAAAGALVTGLAVGATTTAANADTAPINFEGFTVGSPNLHVGWVTTGAFDHKIVDNSGTPAAFGDQSLRISNAVTAGSFGDQTFSPSLLNEAGEAGALSNGLSAGVRQSRFAAEWEFASTVPGAEQPGLAMTVSPDRGDGARMSWLQLLDTPTGLEVRFSDYRDEHVVGTTADPASGCAANDDWFYTTVASGLDRTAVHTVALTMDFLTGPRNDVVRVWVDGTLVHTGTSWEDYYRYCAESNTPATTDHSRTVDSLLFRTGGTAAPATLNHGFLIDNLAMSSGPSTVTDSTGAWNLYPAQSVSSTTDTTTSTSYLAKVRAPINADGTSNFPKRRGVIPVQFDLSSATRTVVNKTTVKGPVVFQSITSDSSTANDYAFLSFTPSAPVTFADIDSLVANYTFTSGNCGGGALRWELGTATGNVFVYFGDSPAFTNCAGGASNSGQNLVGNSDARFDLTQIGGPFYGTYADALALLGVANIDSVSLVLDAGWAVGGEQIVTLTGATVDGATWAPLPAGSVTTTVSDTTTPFASTCALPQAKLKWSKNDAAADGGINEADSIQPKDSGEFFRNVDCKYIYNLDVSSLDPNLGTRQGTYRVWVNIGGTNIQNPAVFDLK